MLSLKERKISILHKKLEKLTNSKVLMSKKLNESIKQGKQLVDAGKLSKEDFEKIKSFDPSPTKKYVGWLCKQFVLYKPHLEDIRNSIEEFDMYVESHRIQGTEKDINSYKTWEDFKKKIDDLNNRKTASSSELENDYTVEVDNDDLFIAVPHSHEASRKLGLSHFAFRNGGSDSAWCTTYNNNSNWKSYYYSQNITFYYIKVRGKEMIKQLQETFPNNWKAKTIMAFAVKAKAVKTGNKIPKVDNVKVFEEWREENPSVSLNEIGYYINVFEKYLDYPEKYFDPELYKDPNNPSKTPEPPQLIFKKDLNRYTFSELKRLVDSFPKDVLQKIGKPELIDEVEYVSNGIDAYDADDHRISNAELKKFREIIGMPEGE